MRHVSRIALPLLATLAIALAPSHAVRAQSPLFSGDLRYMDTSEEVRALQAFLNGHGFPLAESGAGSPGYETSYFGVLTKAALMQFQDARGLPATGFFGPLTRAAAEALRGNDSSDASSTPAWILFFNEHAPGNGWTPGFGGSSQAASSQTSPDTMAPSVSVTAPIAGSTLAGVIALTASASDDVGVASVRFAIDGSATGTLITSAPYVFDWDSSALADGSHTITAAASDAAGNQTISAGVDITTENAAPDIALDIDAHQTDDQTGMIITWSTDQLSDSKVVYGTNNGGPYNIASSSPQLVHSHSITLPNITAGDYFFKVISANAAGVTATSTQQEFVILSINPGA